jgi:nucleoside-diphosphate-sugar epimerase
MRRSILILGGTRYIGKRLAAALVEKGDNVAVATRGNSSVPSGNRLRHLPMDRQDPASLATVFATGTWDVVYDMICYAPSDAADLITASSGRIGRYVMVSSQAVYGAGVDVVETAFNPLNYPVRMGRRGDFSYGEGKRLAEAVLIQQAPFPVATARFPVILGPDDYTGRLEHQIERVRSGVPLPVIDPGVEMSLISSSGAAAFLLWLGGRGPTGPFNAASSGALSVAALIDLLEDATDRMATITRRIDDDPFSLLTSRTLTLSTAKTNEAGFTFNSVNDWLPALVAKISGKK